VRYRARYPPISDYGAIGNLRTVALVGRDGSIDWCCLPEMDAPSVFAAILDLEKGGSFRVAPRGMERGEQEYLADSNVLRTTFRGDGFLLSIVDFLPLAGDLAGSGGARTAPEIHRLISVEGGEAEVDVLWSPRFDYAREAPEIVRGSGGFVASAGDHRLALGGLDEAEGRVEDDGAGAAVAARPRLRPAQPRVLVTRWAAEERGCGVAATEELLEETLSAWRGWVRADRGDGGYAWAGSHSSLVTRSELALKLLTHNDTGAIAAAPTTSLPEEIGGVRNWDYRFTWIRDASLTAQALASLGHSREAEDFLLWAERVSEARCGDDWHVQIMYGLHGEAELTEVELDHLEGYRGSRPVRIGNAAAKQLQLDVYGELLDSAYELVRRGIELETPLLDFLGGLADRAATRWPEPDYGIWEVRRDPLNFVYSKMMIWVALDRALHLAEAVRLPGDRDAWSRARAEVRASILAHGYNREVGAFTQAYENRAMDASNLMLPLHEFLPIDDPRVQGTIDRILRDLTRNGLVYRYRTDEADDGLPGGEGAFGLCTFWMVDALALSGRLDEAWEIFDGMAARANHLGLLPEQIDSDSGEFRGNFPQAFSHIGLINSRLYLAHAEGVPVPEPAPIGTPQHRREAGHVVGRAG
jgi:GH15 family glucan-1,4-alpha-glucosidase